MSSMYKEMLKSAFFSASQTTPSVEVGAYRNIGVQIRLEQAATGTSTIVLQHANIDEDAYYSDLWTGVEDLAGNPGDLYKHFDTDNFFRFIRFKVVIGADTAVVSASLIARE